MTGAAMWAAIAVHASLSAAGVDPWRARLAADVFARAQPDLRRIAPAYRASVIAPVEPVRQALALAEPIALMVAETTGHAVTVKAAGASDAGEAWATFVDKLTRRVTTMCITDDAATIRQLAAWVVE